VRLMRFSRRACPQKQSSTVHLLHPAVCTTGILCATQGARRCPRWWYLGIGPKRGQLLPSSFNTIQLDTFTLPSSFLLSSKPFLSSPQLHTTMAGDDNNNNNPSIPSWQRAAAPSSPPSPPSDVESQPESKVESTREDASSSTPENSDATLLLHQAAKFLEDPTIRDAPREKKSAFLESKGVSREGIQKLLGEVEKETHVSGDVARREQSILQVCTCLVLSFHICEITEGSSRLPYGPNHFTGTCFPIGTKLTALSPTTSFKFPAQGTSPNRYIPRIPRPTITATPPHHDSATCEHSIHNRRTRRNIIRAFQIHCRTNDGKFNSIPP